MDKKVPEIRFEEFEDEWIAIESRKVFQTYYDKNHPDLPVLSASQEHGMVIRDSVGFQVQHNKENEAGYKRVLPGQFVIHLRSFQGGFAHSTVEGITSPAYTIIEFRDKENHDDIFWKYVLTSKEFIKRLETVTYGIRDGRSISFEDFSELGFNVPDVTEQRKIGKLLTLIDKLIDKLEQKLEKLRNIKQALLNQMFINVNRGGVRSTASKIRRI
jgi:type I restriction enzyme S subunit